MRLYHLPLYAERLEQGLPGLEKALLGTRRAGEVAPRGSLAPPEGKLAHCDSAASPTEAAVSVHVCCARALGHMGDPSHGTGDIGKVPWPSIPTGRSALLLKEQGTETMDDGPSATVKADRPGSWIPVSGTCSK